MPSAILTHYVRGQVAHAEQRLWDREPLPHQLPSARGRYNLMRVIERGLGGMAGRDLDGLEGEVSSEIAHRFGTKPRGVFVPWDVEVRALDTSTGAGAKQVVQGPLIELMRARTLAMTLGVQILTDVVGELQLPKLSDGTQAGWVDEGSPLPEVSTTIDRLMLTPRSVGSYIDMTRKMRQSGPGAEAIIVGDFVGGIAAEVDRAVFAGSGIDPEPLGLVVNPAIPSIGLGTDGAPITHADLVAAEKALGNAKADALAFVTTSNARAWMRTTEGFTGSARPLWSDANTVLGYPAHATTQIPSDLEKGSGTGLSAGILGDFTGLVLALFGALDVLVDPYKQGSLGVIRITAFQDADTAVRREEKFIKFMDIQTD